MALRLAAAAEWFSPKMAAGDFRPLSGQSFIVDISKGWPVLARPSRLLATPRGKFPPAYAGETDAILTVDFGGAPPAEPKVHREGWVSTRIAYTLGSKQGYAAVTVSRLSPAALVHSTDSRVVVFRARGLQHYLPDNEPWILTWFGDASPILGYVEPRDVGNRTGVDKRRLTREAAQRLDLPLLFRLERKPTAGEVDPNVGLTLRYAGPMGKVAVMPLMGARAITPNETEAWGASPPDQVIKQCRLWSDRLADVPVDVLETCSVDAGNDAVTVRQAIEWDHFKASRAMPVTEAAPLPPMLALAVAGGAPVRFFRRGAELKPVDAGWMDTAGSAMLLNGGDYEYRIGGLDTMLRPRKQSGAVASEAKGLQAKLEEHVGAMVEAGHLAPLLYIYGGIGGTRFAHYYWLGSPETAHALAVAFPYLSKPLQARVKAYLRAEWKAFPPFQIDNAWYEKGAPRAPYAMPWQDMSRHTLLPRERDKHYRRQCFLFDLYRAWQYHELTGEPPDPKLKAVATRLVADLVAKQDWALMGPVRLHTPRDRHWLRYFTLQGQATYNTWLAGAIGFVRLARKFGWTEEEQLGIYLVGKLALARVGQARYVVEMHRMGLVRGKPEDDWRTLAHIDATCALVGWGGLAAGVHQDQEVPPFIDLVEEVGRWLGNYARPACGIYLDRLDHDIPYWYLSEAPKLGATEHRTCPLQHYNGNVLAQYWVLGKRGKAFTRYLDATRFKGDLYWIQNLAAALDSFAAEGKE